MMKYMFIVLFLVGCGGSNSEVETPAQKEIIKVDFSKKISHRGYGDNSINGFIDAINDGYTIIETDVRIRGGIPVLLHDDVDCDNCGTLSDLLALSVSREIKIIIEFKEYSSIDASIELIAEYGADVVLTSFKESDLVYINSISNYSLGLLTWGDFDLLYLPAIDYLLINKDHIDNCVDYINCVAWTVISNDEFDNIKDKVDYVIEDRY